MPLAPTPARSIALPATQRISRGASVLCLTALVLLLGACSHLRMQDSGAKESPLPASVVQALRDAGINEDKAIALDVRGVDGREVIAHQAQQSFQPASIMKLVTSEAALAMLGPDFRWITRVHASGQLSGDVLDGDLIIEGGGDPRFAHEDLGRLLRALRQLGLREIRGDLVLDRSLFNIGAQDPGAFDGQPSRAYNALPDALLLDAKAITLRFKPEGDRVQIFSEPPLAGFSIRAPAPGTEPCGRLRDQLQPVWGERSLIFAGAYPVACGERELAFHLHVLNAEQYVEAVFRVLWQEQGGSLAGRVREGRVPAGSRELLAWPSRPLAQVLADINKQSNNVMARNLMLSLVAQRGGEPATPEAAAARVLSWMSDSGLSTQGVVIENGSGLSRQERLPAATLAALLQRAWQQPTMPELLSSLAIIGVDGTMARRYGNSPLRGRAHIKTGSLAGVASIAGYVQARSGRRLIVVCMINHPKANEARAAFDALLDWVYNNH